MELKEFKVNDLLNIPSLKDAVVLGGHRFLKNNIKGITIMEAPDIVQWIKGGEVILSSLYSIRFFNEKEQAEFLGRLAEKEVSALVIKKLDVEISSSFIRAAEKVGLPIIQLPKEIPFVDVMYPVMDKLFDKQVKKLQYYQEIHDRFTDLSLADKGPEEIILTLEKLIGNPVALFDRNFHCIFSTEPYLATFEIVEKVHFFEQNAGIKFPHYRQIVKYPELENIKSHQIVVPVETLNHVKTYLLIGEMNKSLEELDLIAVENAATSLSLELVKQFAVAEVEKKFKNDLVDELISGKIQSLQSMYEKANLIGWDFEGSFVAVVFKINTEEKVKIKENKRGISDRNHSLVYEAVHHYLPNGIITNKSNLVIVLWKVDDNDKNNDFAWVTRIKETSMEIKEFIKKHNKDIVVQVGIGNIAKTVIDIQKSYKEASDALELGETINGNESITAYSELGIFRLLCHFKDPAELIQFIPLSLKKLLDYKQANQTDLLKTLQTFLDCQQNAAKTAKELYIHNKTVVYRLDRIKEITGMNFDEAEEMLSVQVGLKIINLLQREYQAD
ncbi:PucR family transcriptional regulator [Cytobacillus depressus]|uniref:PucR family transcriptional regulator n=1 Tax=Cytobacillus depressus TaxID=1602942 RepID=A0A6L3V8N6_9BACI|nr:PucR family transcriptional regulator [Cytobacillus depressus]KAB2337258.1 PucR family transcriptional regulator [Cytobacillus depressus]